MSEWFSRLAPRERLIVFVAGAVLIGLAFHALIISPYQSRLQALQDELDQQQIDLAWMQSAVSRLPAGGVTQNNSTQINGTLVNFVDQTVRKQGLGGQLSSISPVGNDIIRMRLSAVDFNRLMSFVAQIYTSGLLIRDIRVSSSDTPGLVDSNLVLFRS